MKSSAVISILQKSPGVSKYTTESVISYVLVAKSPKFNSLIRKLNFSDRVA